MISIFLRHTVGGVVLMALLATSSIDVTAGPREDRRACWQNYSICASGAGNVNSWRTVCYSDYTACMRNPTEIECAAEDEDYCRSARSRCETRTGGVGSGSYHCVEDHRVCLDAHGC